MTGATWAPDGCPAPWWLPVQLPQPLRTGGYDPDTPGTPLAVTRRARGREEGTHLGLSVEPLWAAGTHQQTVEELVHEQPQGADEQVQQVVEELDVQDHGSVAPGERPAVAHKAHEKDDLIADLEQREGQSPGQDQTKLQTLREREGRFGVTRVSVTGPK